MIERGSGVIVNFSTGWGRSTSPEVATYCSTKWGVEGLTQALSQELPFSPATWAEKAIPILENLGHRDNYKVLTAPGA